MAATMVFIDGGYLDKVLEHEHPGKKIDYARFAVELAKPGELLRAYYYHCLPYQSQTPTEDEKRRYAAKHKFMTALENLPHENPREAAFTGARSAGGRRINGDTWEIRARQHRGNEDERRIQTR